MNTAPGGIHNPTATIPVCPDQTDFLTFRSDFGFAAVYLELIEGFLANDGGGTNIALTNNSVYSANESVPELIARYAEIKRRRYERDRPPAQTPCTITKVVTPTEVTQERTGSSTDATFTPPPAVTEPIPKPKPLPQPYVQNVWRAAPEKS